MPSHKPGSIYSPDTSWGSHLVPLMACVTATRGSVLEVGVGNWSTPLLHCYCAAGGRKLVSADEDRGWAEKFAAFRVCGHEVRGVRYDQFIPEAAKQEWSVVFLDQSPGFRRAADALLFRDTADFILSHDYSGDEMPGLFAPILERWPYRAVAKFSPSTLVLGRVPIPEFEKKVDIDVLACV